MCALKVLVSQGAVALGLGIATSMGYAGPQHRDSSTRDPQSTSAFIVPPNLAQLVAFAPASIVATLTAAGDLQFRDDINVSGKLLATDTFATYQVHVTEVVYNSLATTGPPLAAGTEVTLTQRVTHEDANRTLKAQPLTSGETYLLFLWHLPRSNEWSLFQWPLQFRHAQHLGGTAVQVSPMPGGDSLLTREWLGASIALTDVGSTQAPLWADFVEGVRRLGLARASQIK